MWQHFVAFNLTMNENVVITDKKKIAEIKAALKTTGHFDIKPAAPDKLPENAKKIWFGIDKPINP